MDTGAPYAVKAGIYRMRQLSVECWDTWGPGLQTVVLNIEEALVRFG